MVGGEQPIRLQNDYLLADPNVIAMNLAIQLGPRYGDQSMWLHEQCLHAGPNVTAINLTA